MSYELLKETKFHKEIINNKQMCSSDLDTRWNLFCDRYVDKNLPKELALPMDIYYPTDDMFNVVSEIVSQFPTELNITGKEFEFLKECLIEYSYLQNMMNEVWREMWLAKDVYITMTPQVNTNKGSEVLTKFELRVLPSECCWPTTDPITGDLRSLVYQERKTIYNTKTKFDDKILVVKEYTMDSITTKVVNESSFQDYEGYATTTVPNPFKTLNTMAVMQIRGVSNTGGSNLKTLASKLIQAQFELDNLNTNIQNSINLNANPIWAITGTQRKWHNFAVGPGQLLALENEEDIKAVFANMQLQPLREIYNDYVDRIYKTGGLTPMSLRSKLYATDSARVAKLAQGELIGQIKSALNLAKSTLDKMLEVALFMNNKKYTDEAFEVPSEVLPFDIDAVLNSFAVGMNLGLYDDQLFWDRYMPDLQQSDKDRIREYHAEKQQEAIDGELQIMSMKNTNVTNAAKSSSSTKPMGRKEGNKAQNAQKRKDSGKSTQV